MRSFDRALLVAYLRPHWRRAALLTFLLLSAIVLQLANPEVVNLFISRAQAGGSFDELIQIALLLLAIVLLAQVATVLETSLAEDLAWRTTNALRADLTRHILELDGSFHSAYSPGELIERIDGDVAAIADFFSRFVTRILGNGVFLAGVLVLLFITDWRVGLVMAACSALAAGYLVFGGGRVTIRAREAREAAAGVSGFVEERYEGLDDIVANGARAYTHARFEEYVERRFRTAWSSSRAATWFNSIVGVLFAVGMGAALLVSALLNHSGGIAIGSIYVIFRYSGMLQEPVEQLTQQINSLQQAAGGIVRVRELLNTKSRVKSGSRTLPVQGASSVAFQGVSFQYEDSPVLRDVSFSLAPGEVLGLLGRTGSGKTTITRLLFRLHDPRQGVILLDGMDIAQSSLSSLRDRIGLVTQDVRLFEGSLRDNITLFDSGVAGERVMAAVAKLGLEGWLRSQPEELETAVGPGGSGLSSGESQLLALTRVFLKDPALVVLDEPTSRVDPATRRLIQQGIDGLLAGRTGIIIAHRLETVERVDRIVILEDGEVAEAGRRTDLEDDPSSRFSRLREAGLSEVLA